jgi:GNAT superfamily N-acetyltransferase
MVAGLLFGSSEKAVQFASNHSGKMASRSNIRLPEFPLAKTSAIVCRPVTPSRWGDLEALFGERGACGGCWCMTWRLKRSEWEQGKGESNRRALQMIVEQNERPGVLAYSGREAIGWCSVAPREVFVALGRSRILAPVDAEPVWSISCLFVAKAHRRRGVSVQLIEAAVAFAAKRGAKIVEAYPVEPYAEAMPPVFAWTGLTAAFSKAGFVEVARRSNARPIMRRECYENR